MLPIFEVPFLHMWFLFLILGNLYDVDGIYVPDLISAFADSWLFLAAEVASPCTQIVALNN